MVFSEILILKALSVAQDKNLEFFLGAVFARYLFERAKNAGMICKSTQRDIIFPQVSCQNHRRFAHQQ
jgi:hypothetical protein